MSPVLLSRGTHSSSYVGTQTYACVSPSFVLSTYFTKSVPAAQHVLKTCLCVPKDQNK